MSDYYPGEETPYSPDRFDLNAAINDATGMEPTESPARASAGEHIQILAENPTTTPQNQNGVVYYIVYYQQLGDVLSTGVGTSGEVTATPVENSLTDQPAPNAGKPLFKWQMNPNDPNLSEKQRRSIIKAKGDRNNRVEKNKERLNATQLCILQKQTIDKQTIELEDCKTQISSLKRQLDVKDDTIKYLYAKLAKYEPQNICDDKNK